MNIATVIIDKVITPIRTVIYDRTSRMEAGVTASGRLKVDANLTLMSGAVSVAGDMNVHDGSGNAIGSHTGSLDVHVGNQITGFATQSTLSAGCVTLLALNTTTGTISTNLSLFKNGTFTRLDTCNATLSSISSKTSYIQPMYSLLSAGLNRCSAGMTAIVSNINELSSGLATINTSVKGLSASINTARTGLSAGLGAINTSVKGMSASISAQTGKLSAGLTSVKSAVNSLSADLVAINTSVKGLSASINTARTGLSSGLTTINNNLTTQTSELSSGLTAIKTAINSLSSGLTAIRTGTQNVILLDDYGWDSENTPMQEQRVVIPYRLNGGTFPGTQSSVDVKFWSASATGTGAGNAHVGGQLVLTTGTASAGNAVVYSAKTARYVGAASNRFRSQSVFSNASSGRKYWGMLDRSGNNGAYFQLVNSTLSAVTLRSGSATAVASTSFNGTTTVPQLSGSTLTTEIYFTNKKCYFVLNDTLMHTVTTTSTPWSSDLNFRIYFQNQNNGSTASKTFSVRVATITRLGQAVTHPRTHYCQSASTVQLKTGPGSITSISVGVPTGTAINLYDSVGSASGRLLQITTPAQANPFEFNFGNKGLEFEYGLYLVSTGTWGAAINYE